ncbi:hypothetical protein KI387_013001, partial [Taxus chinensis]
MDEIVGMDLSDTSKGYDFALIQSCKLKQDQTLEYSEMRLLKVAAKLKLRHGIFPPLSKLSDE